MKITILGSGTAIARATRAGSGVLVEGDHTAVLLDCGRQVAFQFTRALFDSTKLNHICISHSHADHISDLVPLLQSIYVRGLMRPELKKKGPIMLHGYSGFKEDYAALRRIMFPEQEDFEITVVEHENDRVTYGEVTLTAHTVPHVDHFFKAVAYRLENNGKTVMYSGDSGYSEHLVKLAHGADIAILEAGIPPQRHVEVGARSNHLSPQEAGGVAKEAGG